MNNKVYISNLQEAIKAMHGCESEHLETNHVSTGIGDKVVWDGDVETFRLVDHAVAEQCYAWGSLEGDRMECVAVLGIDPINTPLKAVMAYIGSRKIYDSSNTV